MTPEYARSDNFGLSDRVLRDMRSIGPSVYGTFGLIGRSLFLSDLR